MPRPTTKSITRRQVKYSLKEKECLCNSRKGSPSVTLRKVSSPRRSSPHPWNEFVKAYREDNPGLSYKQVLISASAVYKKTKGGSQPSYDNQGYDDSYSPFLPSSPAYKPFSPPPTKKKSSPGKKKKSPTPAKKKYNTRINPEPKKQFPLLQRRRKSRRSY